MSATVLAAFRKRVRRHPRRAALRSLGVAGAPADAAVTWAEWAGAVDCTAAFLAAAGRRPGEVAAVLAGNTMLWPVADLAILAAGMRSAGIYPTSSAAQLRTLLADCRASVVFVEGAEQLAKVRAVAPMLPELRLIVVGQGEARPPAPHAAGTADDGGANDERGPRTVSWARCLAEGAAALVEGVAEELARREAELTAASTALLIYTSGSTGEPKGARISHRYLLESAASIRDVLGLTDADTTLSFLPYCHAGERVFGLYTRILCGIETGLVADHTRLWDAACRFGPTLFGGLPRFYEKVFEVLQGEREAARGAERERWERVLEAGRLRSRLLRTGASVPAGHERRWREDGAPLFARVREHFGGRLRLATSGGAALAPEVAEFLDALGVTVLGAYGLTEHLCVAFNRPDRYVFDGVGPPMPGTELRIAGDGEILVRRCALTFDGYLGRDTDTADAFTPDGEWLRTGDLGVVDSEGMLHVTGRKKELIALSTGKKVAPLPIEVRLREDPWVAQAMVYGEGRKFVSALICLRRGLVERWAREQGLAAPADYGALILEPTVVARVQALVERVNAQLSGPERIRRLILLDREFSVEDGELTPTLKLRRAVITDRYRDRLDTLYTAAP